ncbi:DUF1905 domain-containing protein [Emticicia sp. CRIBPO]|uniref:YdeI/OmpD-associated family protein n=1 Tax=Emticicia sp. CRIBPO TaxID=2683258 RepID=UPI001412DEBD|nr:YdeI/OmpD-associated family protein [Emticicia sp. CRIBPO]NBA86488.1 DUF1905 domain-containing protein [Emticicia sp. CRIBPO]
METSKITFTTILLTAKKTATGIEVPEEVVEQLAAGKKTAVKVTINGHTYRSSIASMGGVYMIGVSAEVREKAGVSGGDSLTVELELDTEVREVELPEDFKAALEQNPQAKAFYESLSYSNKRRYVEPIGLAKTEETRARRIEKAVADLAEYKK